MSESVTIYTDGGCTGNPGPGGWAAIVMFGDEKVFLSGGHEKTTNNQMEMTAVIMALKEVRSKKLEDRTVNLFTDSQYVKNGITSWIHNWIKNGWKTAAKKPVKNREYWQEMHKETQGLDLSWHWVKGHAGNEWNERCDQMVEKERMKFK